MKSRTIKRIIRSKLDKWIESIEDPRVREVVKRDVIVTGGSIASMLLREKVNDFDIYFKTKKAVTMVCDYYLKQLSNIKIQAYDKKKVESQDTTDWEEGWDDQWSVFRQTFPEDEDRVKIWIPGIAYWSESDNLLLEEVEELDVFKTILGDVEPPTKEEKKAYRVVYVTENAISLSDQIQLVVRFYGDVNEIHSNYDFVHATNYYDYKENKLDLKPEALESLLIKELRYVGSKYPLTSVIRTKKFIQRGWTVTAGTYLKILLQLNELNLKDPVVLQEQLIGVDIAYFTQLINAIRNVKEENLTYEYISTIIDKIFHS